MPPLIVIKVGTSTLMKINTETGEQRVNLPNMGGLVDTVTTLHRKGYGVIIVTSAAVGFGCLKLKMTTRPTSLALKQAVAAAGQSSLIRMYEDLFAVYNVPVAQVLLSRFDFSAKDRFANVQNALKELLLLRVIPIINENDTVSTDELRFGNNDTLSALVAVGVAADKLFLLTDVDYLFTGNPRTNPDAVPIHDVSATELSSMDMISADTCEGGAWGTGGMATKIIAARTAVCAGIETILAHGACPGRVLDFMDYRNSTTNCVRPACTLFHLPSDELETPVCDMCVSTMTPLRRWLLALPVRGSLWLDHGACLAVVHKSSLFAAGIVEVQGKFCRDECVSLINRATGSEFARALMNLNYADVDKVKGVQSHELEKALGFLAEPELAHRRNIIIVAPVEQESLDV